MNQKENTAITENIGAAASAWQEEPYKSGIVQYMDSREVAEIVGKEHKDLMRNIRRYIGYFNESNLDMEKTDGRKIAPVDFFVESEYMDSKGERRPCYLITRKGCEFIAHKLTGKKGTLFTATYINRFHEMEDTIRSEAGYISAEAVKQIVKEQIDSVLAERGRSSGTGIGFFDNGSSYGDLGQYTIEIRKQELYAITSRAADLLGDIHTSILHQMYKVLEKKFGIVLDAYKFVYRSETGRQNACMVEVISANDRLYEAAMSMNEYVIREYTITQYRVKFLSVDLEK